MVLDGVGGEIGQGAFAITAEGGVFSAHGAASGGFTPVDQDAAWERGITVRGISDVQFSPEEGDRRLREVLALAAAGRVAPVIGRTYPLEDAAEAPGASRRARSSASHCWSSTAHRADDPRHRSQGTVGRQVVEQLVAADQPVRAVARDPDQAGLPDGVELVAGDLAKPATLAPHLGEVDAVFLLWPFPTVESVRKLGAPLIDTLAARVGRVVYLSATQRPNRPAASGARSRR